MLAVYDQIRRMAPSRAPVFITGESGTGKELCAEAIHEHAGAGERPFVAINCSAIPQDLMESEIFGHVRGAFTGATDNRAGAAERADGGTLFLDEIAEMELGLQAKLLRFLQSRHHPAGRRQRAEAVDVRIVCATNRDPFAEVARRPVSRRPVLPAARPADPPAAAARAARRHHAAGRRVSRPVRGGGGRALRGFDARRRRADALSSGRATCANSPTSSAASSCSTTATAVERGDAADDAIADVATRTRGAVRGRRAGASRPFWQQERRIIEAALAAFGGNIARAAAALEISPSTIYRKRQSWVQRLLNV